VVALALFVVIDGTHFPVGAFLVVAPVAGFAGCQTDSVLGETLENRGFLTKGSTNFLGMLSAILIAALLLALVGLW
jgi:uncharacterized membrane protein